MTGRVDEPHRRAISKLIVNASDRSEDVVHSAESALDVFATRCPDVVMSIIGELVARGGPSIVTVCASLFSRSHDKCDLSVACPVFRHLQSWFAETKDAVNPDKWIVICNEFIVNAETARVVFEVEPYSIPAVQTLLVCAQYVPNDIVAYFEKHAIDFSRVPVQSGIRLMSLLAKSADRGNGFMCRVFTWVFQHFVRAPSMYGIEALNNAFGNVYEQVCPVSARRDVLRLCEIVVTLEEDVCIEALTLMTCMAFDGVVVKYMVEVIMRILHRENREYEKVPGSEFPIDTSEMPPSHPSHVFSSSLAALLVIYKVHMDTVLAVLLVGIDGVPQEVRFIALSHLIQKVSVSEDQEVMIVKAIVAATSKKVYEQALCRLTLDVMNFASVTERQITEFANYIADAAIVMRNAHFFLQIVSVRNTHLPVIFGLLRDFLNVEQRTGLLPSLSQVLNLLMIRLTPEDHVYYVHEPPEDAKDAVLHPLVPVFMKWSIPEKSVYLLRILSALMSTGALHPFVPSMLSNLGVFFEFTFPLAFNEIRTSLESVARYINTNTEFPAIIVSLLSSTMQLLNDRQFLIALSAAVMNEVECNMYSAHTQNCLSVFGTVTLLLPSDVAGTNVRGLLAMLPFDDSLVVTAFAKMLGVIAGVHQDLVLSIVETWNSMKSNAAFPVGKSKSPVPYSFVCFTLGAIARDLDIDVLIKKADSLFFPFLLNLTKYRDIPVRVILSTMGELCSRLCFQRVANKKFAVKKFDVILKYVIQTLMSAKQQQVCLQCLAVLRDLIQVQPCLTRDGLTLLMKNVIDTQYIKSTLVDQRSLAEIRGLLTAVMFVYPETGVLEYVLKAVSPLIENRDALVLLWSILSTFRSCCQSDHGRARTFGVPKLGKIGILNKLVTDLLAVSSVDNSDRNFGLECASLVIQIDRNETLKHSSVRDVLVALSSTEFEVVVSMSLAAFRKCNVSVQHGYSHVICEAWYVKEGSLKLAQLEILCSDVLSEKVASSADFLQRIVATNSEMFMKLLMKTAMKLSTLQVVSATFSDVECVEKLSQQFCMELLAVPQDEQEVEKLLQFCDYLLSECKDIPPVHIFQIVCSLMVFGIIKCGFDYVSSIFVPELQSLNCIKEISTSRLGGHMNSFLKVWVNAVKRALPEEEPTITASEVVAHMAQIDESMMIAVMNFFMTTCHLTHPTVASSVALFAGEVINKYVDYSTESRLFNLYFSSVLSLASGFGNLPCVCGLNEITKLMRRSDVISNPISGQYMCRILQFMIKVIPTKIPEIIASVTVCLSQFCASFNTALERGFHEFILAIIIELFRIDQFDPSVNMLIVLDSLIRVEQANAFDKKYRLLRCLSCVHFSGSADSVPFQVTDNDLDDLYVILNRFMDSESTWMVCAAVDFLAQNARSAMPEFGTRIIELIASPDDLIAQSASNAVALLVSE